MQTFTITQVADNASAIKAMGAGDRSQVHRGGEPTPGGSDEDVCGAAGSVDPDINPLDLHKIEALPHGGIRIGALVPNSDLAYDARIKD